VDIRRSTSNQDPVTAINLSFLTRVLKFSMVEKSYFVHEARFSRPVALAASLHLVEQFFYLSYQSLLHEIPRVMIKRD